MNEQPTIREEKDKAEKVLDKFKKYEQSIKLHEARIDDKTIVYCKNEDRIEQYKKLK